MFRKLESMRRKLRKLVLILALKRLLKGREQGKISNIALVLIFFAWGNIFYTASWMYLRQVAKCVLKSNNAILECGSGATTLIVGALTAAEGRKVQVLEHNLGWYHHIEEMLKQVGVTHIELVYAPIRPYKKFNWYGPPENFQYSQEIDLVICDGPPTNSTVGGRYGMLPLVSPYLSQPCTILLDDTHRKSEKRILSMWKKLANFELHHTKGLVGDSTEITVLSTQAHPVI